MKKILFWVFICSICFAACEKDPDFSPEDAQAEVTKYLVEEDPVYADVYVQVESNLTTFMVKLQYSVNVSMEPYKIADFIPVSNYPDGFSKKNSVFNCHLSDLENNTTYYGNILVMSPLGTILKTVNIHFSTRDFSKEGLYIENIEDITLGAASIIGCAPLKDKYSYTNIGFYYSLDADLKNAQKVRGKWITYNDLNLYTGHIGELFPNTTYYCAAVATIEGNEYVSETVSFKTLSGVITGDAYNITTKAATCSFYVDDLGDYNISEQFDAGILYGTSKNLSFQNGRYIRAGNFVHTGGTYEVDLSNLTSGVTYYYCAYAQKDEYSMLETGSMLGEIKSFTTK